MIFSFGCGPNQDEINNQINEEFNKLISVIPTPLPTATPVSIPTPLPTATPVSIPTPSPSILSNFEEDLIELLANPYATPVTSTGLDIKNAYEKFRLSIVLIESDSSFGTGWAISPNYIVTNEHVISSTNSVDVYVPSKNGKAVQKKGLIKSWDADADLAFIKVENHGATPLLRRTLISADAGTAIIQLGHSTGVENYPAARHGIVVSVFNQQGNSSQYGTAKKYQTLKGVEYSEDLFPVVVINTGADPGDSGGPIIDYDGNVVGVVYGQVQSVGGKRVIGQQLAVGVRKLNSYWNSCTATGGSCD